MKYEAKNDGGGKAVSQAAGTPWISIKADDGIAVNDTDAFEKCANITEAGFGGTFSLISNPEWMTIARDIENTVNNWSGGVIGTGHIPRGHSDNSPPSLLAITNTLDPYNGTLNNSGEAPGSGWEQKRTHTLSNGSVIWDLSGNVTEWVDWDSGIAGFTLGPGDEVIGYKELSIAQTGSLLDDDFLPIGAYTSVNSFGRWYGGNGKAMLRGGSAGGGVNSGVFGFSLNVAPTTDFLSFGFRCSYRP